MNRQIELLEFLTEKYQVYDSKLAKFNTVKRNMLDKHLDASIKAVRKVTTQGFRYHIRNAEKGIFTLKDIDAEYALKEYKKAYDYVRKVEITKIDDKLQWEGQHLVIIDEKSKRNVRYGDYLNYIKLPHVLECFDEHKLKLHNFINEVK